MKDSSKLLNFNSNRKLGFNPVRRPGINMDRDLSFDLDRGLSFNVDRDLGFGKRGVLFRGYICPVCGASVGVDDPQCEECGVMFEQRAKAKSSKSKKRTWERGKKTSKSKKTKTKKPKPQASKKKRRNTFQCPVCGKLLYVGTATCPGCNIDFDVTKKTETKVTRSAPPSSDVLCSSCGYSIPPGDKFCRRCGSRKQAGGDSVTITLNDYKSKPKDDGIITWDEYSKRG
jgi:predicted nucleic acid-binding Zn ribbon protein